LWWFGIKVDYSKINNKFIKQKLKIMYYSNFSNFEDLMDSFFNNKRGNYNFTTSVLKNNSEEIMK